MTFTASAPTFRVDWRLDSGTTCNGNASTQVRSCNGNRTTGTRMAGAYEVKLQHNKDGSVSYTVTLEEGVDRACINLGKNRYLIDPDKLAEQSRARQEYNPPVQPPPEAQPPPDATRQYFPDPVPPAAGGQPEPVQPAGPPQPPVAEPLPPDPGGDPFTPAAVRRHVEALTYKATADALKINPGTLVASELASGFFSVPELDGLLPNGNGPEESRLRSGVALPITRTVYAGPDESSENIHCYPRRYGNPPQAGVFVIRDADLLASVEHITDPAVKEAITTAHTRPDSRASIDQWFPNGRDATTECQLRSDGSVVIRPLAADGAVSQTATVYGPSIVNGRLTWRKSDVQLNTSDGRYYPATP